MVAQKFGSSDPDMSSRVGKKKGTKEISDKPMESVTAKNKYTGMMGGESNKPGPAPNRKKPGAS